MMVKMEKNWDKYFIVGYPWNGKVYRMGFWHGQGPWQFLPHASGLEFDNNVDMAAWKYA